jgi:predicted alpha/beta superfamily hydrolase
MRLALLFTISALALAAPPTIVDARTYFPDLEGHTITGNVKIIEGFEMPQFQRTRRIWVYLPPNYESTKDHYPVLYLEDGQNAFDKKTSFMGEWKVDETLEALFAGNKTKGAIVVAIENGREKRNEEYVPAWFGVVENPQGGKYAEFVARTLKPYIDANFRTQPGRESSGVAGSSGGAIISFHIGMAYPDVFSKIGAFSFTIPASAAPNIPAWRDSQKKHPGMRIYLHIGTEENLGDTYPNTMWVDNLKALYTALQSLGYDDSEVKLDIQPGGHHNEASWSAHFAEVFLWLYRP